MVFGRSNGAAALFALSLLIVLMAARGSEAACNETCRRDIARCMAAQCVVPRCMATQCAGVGRAACRRRCKPAPIRTLAYVLSECRVNAAGMEVGRQALRIRQGDREPITVVEFGPSEPVPDPQGLCRLYGESRNGSASMAAGPFQRLGVSPDGSEVVFEVTSEAPVVLRGNPPLPPDQQGLFFVHADGSGLRRLGPASRERSFRFGAEPDNPGGLYVTYSPLIPFSPNGRRIAFTDLGPGPDGKDAVQIVVLDLATGERTQVTRLPPGTPRAPSLPYTGYPRFIDNETVAFFTVVDPDGSNPEHAFTAFTARIDGSRLRLKQVPPAVAATGARVISIFGVAQLPTDVFSLAVPGTPTNPTPGATGSSTIGEVFVQEGRNLIQLTTFRRVDTTALFLNVSRTRAFFSASASGNCQLFSIGTRGTGLRQLTHFNPGNPGMGAACWNPFAPNCSVGQGGVRLSRPDDERGRLRVRLRPVSRQPLRRAGLRHALRRQRAPPADRRRRIHGEPGRQHQSRTPRPVRLLGSARLTRCSAPASRAQARA
jgi:hypothetical protein